MISKLFIALFVISILFFFKDRFKALNIYSYFGAPTHTTNDLEIWNLSEKIGFDDYCSIQTTLDSIIYNKNNSNLTLTYDGISLSQHINYNTDFRQIMIQLLKKVDIHYNRPMTQVYYNSLSISDIINELCKYKNWNNKIDKNKKIRSKFQHFIF